MDAFNGEDVKEVKKSNEGKENIKDEEEKKLVQKMFCFVFYWDISFSAFVLLLHCEVYMEVVKKKVIRHLEATTIFNILQYQVRSATPTITIVGVTKHQLQCPTE